MTEPTAFPESYSDLIIRLHELKRAQTEGVQSPLLTFIRDLKLLPPTGFCSHCGKEGATEIPSSDATQKSKCSDPKCRQAHAYKRSIHYSNDSVFAHFKHSPKEAVVKGIYCFVLQKPPSSAAEDIGGVSESWVCRLYDRIRMALQFANKKYHSGRLGGRVTDGNDPIADTAVFVEGIYRKVVEADES